MKTPTRRILLVVALVSLAGLIAVVPAGAHQHETFPATDYDLSGLGFVAATYDPGSGAIRTVDPFNSKVLLPPMPAAPSGGRFLEVEITPTAPIDVGAVWYEADGQPRNTGWSHLDPGANQVVLLDLSAMGPSDGDVRIRLFRTSAEATIHRITLYEDEAPVDAPNIIFILVDDLRTEDLELGFGRSVPGRTSAIETEMIDGGVTLDNFFFGTPLCCPSRASFLTGQYPHNHGVWTNNGHEIESGNGGILHFYREERDLTSLGTWMQAAGYDTALVGKYLNGYPNRQGLVALGVTENYIPRGWDDWHATLLHDKLNFAPIKFRWDHFRINNNGAIDTYGPGAYLTDVERQIAVDYIDAAAADPDPFFLFLSPYAPHGPNKPAPRHNGIHKDLKVKPELFPAPACNEGDPDANDPDDSDKPDYIRDTIKDYGRCWGIGALRKLDMTLALDEMIGDIYDTLRENGIENDTYVFFASDNGLLNGEHGISGKSAPYEESIRVPLLVTGPEVPPGERLPHLAGNIDIAPTLLEIAAGTITEGSPPIDGESLLGVMTGAVADEDWRDGILVELLTPGASPNQQHVVPTYGAARTRNHIYVEYGTAEREFYDLAADPYQLHSGWDAADDVLQTDHLAMLAALRDCIGTACATAARWSDPNTAPEASFTVTCPTLVCEFDGSVSQDLDGVVVKWAWDFGGGATASGPTVVHNFATLDPQSVTLTVTDNRGAAGSTTDVAQPIATGFSHVESLRMVFDEDRDAVRAVVRVDDQTGAHVIEALVAGTWTRNGEVWGSYRGETNAAGKTSIRITLPSPVPGDSLEFCVDGILHSTFAYDAGADAVVPACVAGTWP